MTRKEIVKAYNNEMKIFKEIEDGHDKKIESIRKLMIDTAKYKVNDKVRIVNSKGAFLCYGFISYIYAQEDPLYGGSFRLVYFCKKVTSKGLPHKSHLVNSRQGHKERELKLVNDEE